MKNISITINEITEDIHLELIPVGLPGPRGFNAFEVWQKGNPGGTMEEYYQFLKGEPFRFEDFTPEQIAALKIKGDPFTFDDFTPEQLEALKVKGDDGRTAYEVAVANGFPGSESEWLDSLKGEPFKFEDFTEAQKESLKIKGDEGLSAYEVAVNGGFIGTESEWLASLKGETGDMPIGALNEFLLNYFDEPIVNLHSRAQNLNQKLRFVQKELDELEVTPNLMINMAATSPGKLHSVIPSDGSGDWTVERNSIATYVDKDGSIKTVSPSVPRIDWRSGEPMLLLEGRATNINIWSEHDPGWTGRGTTPPIVNGTDFSGGKNCCSVTFTDELDSGWNGSRVTGSYLATPEGHYTYSCLVKLSRPLIEDESVIVRVTGGRSFPDTMFTSNSFVDEKWTPVSGSMFVDTSTTEYFAVFAENIKTPITIYVTDRQLEEGTVPTSYIPSKGVATTRIQDYMFIRNLPQSLKNLKAGVIFIELGDVVMTGPTSSRVSIGSFNNLGLAQLNNLIRIKTNETSILTQVPLPFSKIAIKFSPSGVMAFSGGKLIGQNSEVISGLEDLRFLSYPEIEILNIKSFHVYSQPLSDEQCLSLTTK